jgi:hypothetical protein
MDGVGVCMAALKDRIEDSRLSAQYSLLEQGRQAEAEEKLETERRRAASRMLRQAHVVEGGEWLCLSSEAEISQFAGDSSVLSGRLHVRSV